MKSTINKISLVLAAALLAAPAQAQRARLVMGTPCEIDAPQASAETISAAFAELERWDRILSLYKEESELSALNRAAGKGPLRVSPDLYAAVETALRLARDSEGAFDPTILPVLRGGPRKLPLVGWRKVRLDPDALTIELPETGMGLDFGGIGKGWALDKAAEVMKKRGVERALFNFGGQILAMGSWPVSVPGRAEPLTVENASLAVSGDSEHPGHIVSPFDGLPARRPGSAAALADSATQADAWSTALFVLGKNPPSFHGRSFFDSGTSLGELERKVDLLTQEIEKLKVGEPDKPAARKVSIGGYGEFVVTSPSKRRQDGDPSGLKKRADLQRVVLYTGYKFTDSILFNSEIEFEHGGSGEAAESRGEITIEQAYLDFKLRPGLTLRAGNVLVPLGLVNEAHEPTAFHGVNRPNVERSIIQSTWHENGAGLFGDLGPVSYRSYILAGLNAKASGNPTTDGFTGSNAIRGGRTAGSNTSIEDLAWASRLDVSPFSGVKAGAGLYIGQADQCDVDFSVPVTLWETHAAAEWRGAALKALYAEGRIGNADALNAAQGFTNAAKDSVGSRFFGGYAEAAFDVLSLVESAGGQSLSAFFRYERYDTQAKTPEAYAKNPANSRVEYTLGATYKPIPQIALKLDQQWKRNQVRTGVNQWNLGLGYIF